MTIRPLRPADAAAFHALRLRGLRESPEAFGSTYGEEVDRPLADREELLSRGEAGEHVTFGAFDDGGRLMGVAAVSRGTNRKARHRAVIWGMYVGPEARGRGAGRALLEAIVAHVRTLDGVDRLVLAVTVGNDAARALYASFGFVPYGVEPDAYRLGGQSWNSELMTLALDGAPGG